MQKADILLPPTGPQPIEYVYIAENPLIKTKRQTGHFGPFPMKNTGDFVMYSTGLAFTSGMAGGTVYGIWRGLVTAKVNNYTVRMNNVLNMSSRYSTFSANSLSTIALQFTLLNSFLKSGLFPLPENEAIVNITSGVLTGMLFKSTAGARMCLGGGLFGGMAVGIWSGIGLYMSQPTAATVQDVGKELQSLSKTEFAPDH